MTEQQFRGYLKGNIMKFTDGLFLNTAREVAKSYEGKIAFEEALVDNMAMQLVQKPRNYDVLVLPIFTAILFLTFVPASSVAWGSLLAQISVIISRFLRLSTVQRPNIKG
jgi:hypothetical protein